MRSADIVFRRPLSPFVKIIEWLQEPPTWTATSGCGEPHDVCRRSARSRRSRGCYPADEEQQRSRAMPGSGIPGVGQDHECRKRAGSARIAYATNGSSVCGTVSPRTQRRWRPYDPQGPHSQRRGVLRADRPARSSADHVSAPWLAYYLRTTAVRALCAAEVADRRCRAGALCLR